MTVSSFSDRDWLVKTIKGFLNKVNIKFSDENPNSDQINFQFRFQDETTKLHIIIGQSKDKQYQIDVVNRVKFSPIHVDGLKVASDAEKQLLVDDIFFWLSGKDPNFILDIVPKDKSQTPFYLIILSIYEDELNLGNLMRAIDKVKKSSMISIRLIQLHLDKHTNKKIVQESSNDVK